MYIIKYKDGILRQFNSTERVSCFNYKWVSQHKSMRHLCKPNPASRGQSCVKTLNSEFLTGSYNSELYLPVLIECLLKMFFKFWILIMILNLCEILPRTSTRPTFPDIHTYFAFALWKNFFSQLIAFPFGRKVNDTLREE